MRVAIIGAGPAGLLVGAALAGRGHDVIAVDRDAGPPRQGRWTRRGVMQFHHAHGFRPQVGQILQEEWPEAFAAWIARGAEPISFDIPGLGQVPGGHRSRRDTFERALWATSEDVSGLSVQQAHVDGLLSSDGRVRGVIVGGSRLEADLVVDASGRSGRAVNDLRAPSTVGGLCGMAYVDRQYRLRDGAEPGPMTNPLAWQADFDGYQTIVFLHEHGHFSILLVRPTADVALKNLRHQAAFEAACRAIPGLAEWTDPARSLPITGVLPGGPLRNAYRGQGEIDGRPVVPGLVSVGDAVATTTPTFGRGLATTFVQVRELLSLLDSEADPAMVGEPFDAWCEDNMLPWVLDHMHMDGDLVRRWQGGDLDLNRRLPSDLILSATTQDSRIGHASPGYLSMQELPSCLDAVEPLARAVYASGWRPPYSSGPTRNDLVEIIDAALRQRGGYAPPRLAADLQHASVSLPASAVSDRRVGRLRRPFAVVAALFCELVDTLADLLLGPGDLSCILAIGPLVDRGARLVENALDLVAVLVRELTGLLRGPLGRLGRGVRELVGLALEVELFGLAFQLVHERHEAPS